MASKTASNLAQVARHFDVSRPAVSKWVKDWPFGKRGPFDLDAIARWREATLTQEPEPHHSQALESGSEVKNLSAVKRADLLLKLTRKKKLDVEIDILRGDYIPRAAAVEEFDAILRYVRTVITAAPRATVDLLLAQGEIEEHQRHAIESAMNQMNTAAFTAAANNLSEIGKEPDE